MPRGAGSRPRTLEGNGFELPVRERGESGCRAFLARSAVGTGAAGSIDAIGAGNSIGLMGYSESAESKLDRPTYSDNAGERNENRGGEATHDPPQPSPPQEPPDPPCPTRAGDGLDQVRVIVLDVANSRAHWPACHFLGRIGCEQGLGWVASAVRAKPATSRGIPGAARSSLDVFALTTEMPDILKGETARLPLKRHIHGIWFISRGLRLRHLIVLSPSFKPAPLREWHA